MASHTPEENDVLVCDEADSEISALEEGEAVFFPDTQLDFSDDDGFPNGDADDEDGMSSVESADEGSRKNEAISGLEGLALSFLSQLARSTALRNSTSATTMDRPQRISIHLAESNRARARTLQFPRRHNSGTNARNLAQLFKVMDEAHEALADNNTVTKRDIYYRDPKLFKGQKVVDSIVDDLVASFPGELSRSDLNIRASSKGLFCGSGLTCHLYDGSAIVGHDHESCLIPFAADIEQFEMHDDIRWILIVEKDAIFHTLRTFGLAAHPALTGPGLILTGKGYPDVATRQFVKTFSDNLPDSVKILALADADAYGLDIVSVYKHGSMQLQHENEKLAAERVEWIGVSAVEAIRMGVDRDALLDATDHDQKKALAMLRSDRDLPAEWRRELSWMLHTRKKAEIEVLFSIKAASNDAMDEDSAPTNSLIRYLIPKINGFLES